MLYETAGCAMIRLNYTHSCDECGDVFLQSVHIVIPNCPLPQPETRTSRFAGQDLCEECCTLAVNAVQQAFATRRKAA